VIVIRIDLDDDALSEAMRLMGTTTKKDTVNQALRDYINRVKRVEAAQRLFERGRRGDFDQAAEAHAAAKAARKQTYGE
jgi:Arc/MetJ family transcription regulator